MHKTLLAALLLAGCTFAVPQSIDRPDEWMNATRAMYDDPFERNLVSFQCKAKFDWVGFYLASDNPLVAVSNLHRVQSIDHAVFVDTLRPVVSSVPKVPDFSGDQGAGVFEKVLEGGLTADLALWLHFARGALTTGPVRFEVKSAGQGFKIERIGPPKEQATISAGADRRITTIAHGLPPAMLVDTEFRSGPNGYLLESMKISASRDLVESLKIPDQTGVRTDNAVVYRYEYETVNGFQLPTRITSFSTGSKNTWKWSLTDCKTVTRAAPRAAPAAKR